MLLSRINPLLRHGLGYGNVQRTIQNIRCSHHAANYRCGPPPPQKSLVWGAEIVQGIAWWWILWHLWTEPDHIFGEFEFPDPSKWTNAELGIPSD